MEIKLTPIEEVIKECGLPDNTEFLGYVIHLPQSDEFLLKMKKIHNDGSNIKAWSKTPEICKRYQSYQKALKDCKKVGKGSKVCVLLDAGNALYAPPIS